MSQSKLATVMSQLFPMFTGTVTLSMEEISANKSLICKAIYEFKIKCDVVNQLGTDLGIDNETLRIFNTCQGREESYVWKWFSDNFLSLTFVRGKDVHFSEHPIHRVVCLASAITKLYNRFQIASDVTEDEQDSIHSLKHKFEEWGCCGEFGTAFSISLEEIAIMQNLLNEYYAYKQYSKVFDVANTEPSQYWILNTRNRIRMNIEICLEYLNTLV